MTCRIPQAQFFMDEEGLIDLDAMLEAGQLDLYPPDDYGQADPETLIICPLDLDIYEF